MARALGPDPRAQRNIFNPADSGPIHSDVHQSCARIKAARALKLRAEMRIVATRVPKFAQCTAGSIFYDTLRYHTLHYDISRQRWNTY